MTHELYPLGTSTVFLFIRKRSEKKWFTLLPLSVGHDREAAAVTSEWLRAQLMGRKWIPGGTIRFECAGAHANLQASGKGRRLVADALSLFFS